MITKAPARRLTNKSTVKKSSVSIPVLAYDLGGTKVAVGIVTPQGKVLAEVREPVRIREGKAAVFNQLSTLGLDLLKIYPFVKRVGVASAGPLDPTTGDLLDPTNFQTSSGKKFGRIQLGKILARKLHRDVFIENDAAASVLAEHWIGQARGYKNAMVLTLGTGLGTGIIINNRLVRSGHGLHPEAGHLILRAGDQTALCGCGNLGCAEALLSGNGFAKRASKIYFKTKSHTGFEIAELARTGHPAAILAFTDYAENLAIAIHNYVVVFAPEVVVLTGSFAESQDLFLNKTKVFLKSLLKRRRIGIDLLPTIKISSLDNRAGLIGGGFVALRRNY